MALGAAAGAQPAPWVGRSEIGPIWSKAITAEPLGGRLASEITRAAFAS
jgi:hypothetical protein